MYTNTDYITTVIRSIQCGPKNLTASKSLKLLQDVGEFFIRNETGVM